MSQSSDFVILKKFEPLLQRGRWSYKVFYGGRGGAKSHNFARALLALGAQSKLRILCARELQGSIGDSVHKLLADVISSHEVLSKFYEVQKSTIIGKNGTEFIFKGLKYNATEIKSTEGIDICWVEEAEKVSDASWEVLIPTIRKENSEMWVSFNPRNPNDPTYVRMVLQADDKMLVEKVSWRDNPFLPQKVHDDREKLKKNDPVAYNYIWEGEFDERFQGFVYANLLKAAREAGRIAPVPYKDGIDVITAWDLGNADSTSIWFAQRVGLEVRVIGFYENNFQDLAHYASVIKDKGYRYSGHYLPHDGKHERLGMKGSIKDQLREYGLNCMVLPQGSLESGINLARELLKTAWIDTEKCRAGIQALQNYQYEFDEARQVFKTKPLHDWSSHASDAFRYLAMALNNENPATVSEYIDPFKYVARSGYLG